jgi:hypothetical protein
MNNMIERVAKAMHGSVNTWTAIPQTWDRLNSTERSAFHLAARAAIAAMRDCTPAMLDAGTTAHPRGYTRETLLTDIIEAEWRVMCDAALECSTKQTEK